ncbi:MAG TPA: hypothetical protein DHV48_09730 [Prolixibacteraceae bacterium]|nr:hypothetical protein [Prolixibacteraceae bacterium]
MKAKIRLSIISTFLFAALLVNGQEPQKSETTSSGSGTKAQDHNSTRSNKTASSVAPDNNPEGDDKNTPKANHNSVRSNKSTAVDQGKSESSSKKGYDYYKAQSEMHNKAQDHNSSRSNKTASKVAEDSGAGEGNSKSIDDKTDKSPAARGTKPKPKIQ